MREGSRPERDSHSDGVAASPYRQLIPICQDSFGTTWLGAVVAGVDAGTQVLMTVVGQAPDSLPVRPLLAAARREIKTRHSSLLALLDIEVGADSVTLVSESLEGEPLSTLMGSAAQREEPIPTSVALKVVREAVVALRNMRRKSPLAWPHGLLNPETIFVASCGEVLLRQPETRAAALAIAGYASHPSLLAYRAPEILRDDREDEDCGDVFSAGVLLWEMIAGRGLYGSPDSYRLGRVRGLSSGEAHLVRQRILNEPARSLSTMVLHGAAISPEVARLVDWMLCHDPAARPQGLDELIRVLDALPPTAVASGPQLGHFVNRVLSETFDKRAQLVVDAVAPDMTAPGSRAPSSPAGADAVARTSSVPPAFVEPNTVPRAAALATRLAQQVPHIDEEPPPAAVVSIPAGRRPVRWDGVLAVAAGVLLVGSLGAYLLTGKGAPTGATASDEVVIDEARQRVSAPASASSGPPGMVREAVSDRTKVGAEPDDSSAGAERSPNPASKKSDAGPKKKTAAPPSKTGFRPTGI